MATSSKSSPSAAANAIVLPRDFDAKQMKYGAPRQLDSGARNIFINYGEGKQPLLLQTPVMDSPFGVSCWADGPKCKYSLDVSFKGRDTVEKIGVFFKALESFDTQLVSDAMENSLAWFKKKYPNEEVLRALYTPAIKYAKDRDTGEITDKYPPTFKMTLPFKDDKFQVKCYDSKAQLIDLADILAREDKGKGMRVQAIVQLTSIWVAGGKFGGSWKVKQLQIQDAPSIPDYAFCKDGDDDVVADEEDARLVAGMKGIVKAPPVPAARVRADVVDDSSADEDADDPLEA